MTTIGAIFTRVFPVLIMLAGSVAPVLAAGTVLFDQGHGQRFLADRSNELDLSRLAMVFRQQGFTVKTATSTWSDETLASADALVLSGPFSAPTAAETEALLRHVKRGGRLAIMLHVPHPVTELLHTLGVDFSNSVMHEQRDLIGGDPLNFRVSRFAYHPLFTDVSRFSLYGGWALMSFSENAQVVAFTGPDTWVDLDGDGKLSDSDARQSFGVVVTGKYGYGRFVVFGDDAIFQNRFFDDDNRTLAANLATWLGGDPRQGGEAEQLLQMMHGQ
jgi:hypothetical protein